MKIMFKPYRKRDGELMLYINRSNKISVGLASGRAFSPYSKGVTEGDRNAFNAASAIVKAGGVVFTGNIDVHAEEVVRLPGEWILAVTDSASIGGMQVEQDGAYLIANGSIFRCGEWIEEVK